MFEKVKAAFYGIQHLRAEREKDRREAEARNPIPASQQEWPNHDESWLEFMARKEYEGVHTAGPVTTVLCLMGAAVIVLLALVDALDQGLL